MISFNKAPAEKPLLAAPLAYGRLRRPPLSLLFSLPSAAAPPPFLALSALLSPLVGGCAAPPLCFSSRASFGRLRRPTPSASPPLLRRLRRLTLPRALVGGWRRPLALYTMKSRLSETHMGIGIPLSPDCENQRFSCQGLLRLSLSEACFVTVTCHELFFFSLFRFINHCVDVLGYTALNFKAFGHKFLSFGKFFLLIRKKFVPL